MRVRLRFGMDLALPMAVLFLAASWTQADASTLKTIYTFCPYGTGGCTDGIGPESPLLMDSSGNLYGITEGGGAHADGEDGGTVFELVANKKRTSWTEKVLYNFCPVVGCADGDIPNNGLIADTSGALYGTTFQGGSVNAGVIFKLMPNAKHTKWTYKVLYEFCGCEIDGGEPSSTLTYTGAGSGSAYDGVSPLYGEASIGGKNFSGAVFRLSPKGKKWTLKLIHSFCSNGCDDGKGPIGGLLMDSHGNLYGSAGLGGQNNHGDVFELSPGARRWKETTLYSFCPQEACADGEQPISGVLMDAGGDLFGMTRFGGAGASCADMNGCGTVFKIVPNGTHSQETVLHSFCSESDCGDGSQPIAGLLLDSSGNLFSTTELGGANNGGVLFELNADVQVVYSFCTGGSADCPDGKDPRGGLTPDASGDLFGSTNVGGTGQAGTIFELLP